MALDEPKEDDHRFEDKGLTYVIEKELFDRLKPIKVDYVTSPMGAGFHISSNLPVGCGGSCSC